MIIKPFLDSHKKSLYQLCELLNQKYRYDNHIPDMVLSSKNFEGFVAISEYKKLVGFVGVVFTPAYAFPFGLRVHPDFSGQDVGFILSEHINEYALKKSPIIRSAFQIENEAMQKIISKEGWRTIDKYLLVIKETPFKNYNQSVPISSYLALKEELNEIMNFIVNVKIGHKEYDQMFLNDLIWYPTALSGEIFEELILSRRLLVDKIGGRINAVCIIDAEDSSDSDLYISRIWGKPESLINFMVKNYHPKKIRICIGEVEKEKWQKLGFSTSLAFYNDDLFESKYALIEKKRSVQNITQW